MNRFRLLLLFLLFLGIGYFIGYKNNVFQGFFGAMTNQSQDDKPIGVKEKWVTYTSKGFGISFNYPERWKIEEKHEADNTYIQLISNIPDNDKGNLFYSLWIDTRDNPNNRTFEDLIFPKESYGDSRNDLYSKEVVGDLNIYKTNRLISQSGTYHYFLTRDGRNYINIHFFPYYSDHPVINQDKIIDYLNRITSTLEITGDTASQTQVIKYKPVSIPEKNDSGSCWTTSIATPSNEKAWRCSAGNLIYDPCFDVGDNKVVCDPNPEKNGSGLVLKLTEKLPSVSNRPKLENTHPWIYKLANNIRCYAQTGTAESIDGDFYYYVCDNKALMEGDVQRKTIQKDKQPWVSTIVYQDNNFKVSRKETLPIFKIWW